MKIHEQMKAVYKAGVPAILWGPPGVGKTSAVEALAAELGVRLFTPYVGSPEDFALPVEAGDGVKLLPVDQFLDIVRDARPGDIVFVDEMTTKPPALQAVLLRFVDSGLVGGYRLDPAIRRFAAANPPHQAAGGFELAPPTANRFLHLEFTVDPATWPQEFATNWGKPLDPAEQAWRVKVAAFLTRRPELIVAVPEDIEQAGQAWPSPRTWDMACKVLAAAGRVIVPLLAGAVGPAAAAEFAAWLDQHDLPLWTDVLDGTAPMPQRSDLRFAVAMAAAVQAPTMDTATWHKAWDLVRMLAQAQARDIAALLGAALVKHRGNRPVPQQIRDLAGIINQIASAKGGV